MVSALSYPNNSANHLKQTAERQEKISETQQTKVGSKSKDQVDGATLGNWDVIIINLLKQSNNNHSFCSTGAVLAAVRGAVKVHSTVCCSH